MDGVANAGHLVYLDVMCCSTRNSIIVLLFLHFVIDSPNKYIKSSHSENGMKESHVFLVICI